MILIVFGAAFLGLVGSGIYLWWPSRHDPASRSAVGAAVLTGAVVSFAILLLQVVMEARLDEIEQRRLAERSLQDLRQQVASSQGRAGSPSGLEGFDFHVGNADDLSGFYFVGKILSGADFRGLTLNGANFTGADLSRALLDRAKLHDAEFIAAKLENTFLTDAELTGADLTSACLRLAHLAGANLTGADLSDADLSDAEYDAKTVWPDGKTRKCDSVECPYPEQERPGESCN